MHRFYAEGVVQDMTVRLAQEDARHARLVLRMQPGDEAEVYLNDKRYAACLQNVDEKEVTATILRELPTTEASVNITLFQGLPKAEKMDLIVQKAVELGAVRVVPVSMSRSVVKLNGKDAAKKQERWQKIAREASKQSGRCRMLQVDQPVTMKQMLQMLKESECAVVPWEEEHSQSLKQVVRQNGDDTSYAIVIGPEGGMSSQEIDAMKAQGCIPVTLGPRIMRTETAGLAAIAAVMCLTDNME